ncbi:MAG: uracil-DNA glycosylase [Nitrosomonadales bacterium]|nr:uracil-DNA glycosylase [Nitrosomonadales bacterium]
MSEFPDNWRRYSGLSDADVPIIPEPAYPPPELRYRALESLAPDEVRVVILGQDPYHGTGEAHGLAFSVPEGVRMPPSLRNIYAELVSDLGVPPPRSTDLTRWAEQGVLLLNTALTVAPDSPASHANLGWTRVTDGLIRSLAESETPRVFVLWGKHAQARRGLIADDGRHLVIESPHPSPFAARKGFFGSRPFSRINLWLKEQGRGEIDWR